MVDRETMLWDIAFLGGCSYCKHDTTEQRYYNTIPTCKGCCTDCEIKTCPCNGCEDYSKWQYFRD